MSFFKNLFYWSILDLQCCVNFCYTAKWFIGIHVYVCALFHILFCCGLWQDIVYSSLCYTIGPCLSTLYVSLYLLTPNSQPNPLPPPSPLLDHKSVLYASLQVIFSSSSRIAIWSSFNKMEQSPWGLSVSFFILSPTLKKKKLHLKIIQGQLAVCCCNNVFTLVHWTADFPPIFWFPHLPLWSKQWGYC